MDFLLSCDPTTECDEYECGTGVCGGDCMNTCAPNEVYSGNSCVCDVANECNGLQCGTGFCGGDCNVVSDFVEIYVLIHVVLMKYALKIFVCDVAIECNGLECGTGFCGGDYPNSCSSFEKCDINMCVCDLANECNGLECGVGVCGNLCSHTVLRMKFALEILAFVMLRMNVMDCNVELDFVEIYVLIQIGICGNPCMHTLFENCAQCDASECIACFGGYYLKDGECFASIERCHQC